MIKKKKTPNWDKTNRKQKRRQSCHKPKQMDVIKFPTRYLRLQYVRWLPENRKFLIICDTVVLGQYPDNYKMYYSKSSSVSLNHKNFKHFQTA